MVFNNKAKSIQNPADRLPEFSYIDNGDIYMDSACQSMRPQPVIDTLNEYYQTYNACGERVKYKWGQKVDANVEATRESVLNYLGLTAKDYICSFTLNTTYGINLILNQLPSGIYKQVITSEIEHNSVFLPTIELSKRLGIPRKVLPREDDGRLIYSDDDLDGSVVVVNAASNIDGRLLLNIKQLIKDTHNAGGIVIIDAAQAAAHYRDLIAGCAADAFCFSAHKMYSSSLGVIVIRKKLLESLDKKFVGGGMVASVKHDSYQLLPEEEMYSWLEPGLQAWGEIISLGRAVKWLQTVRPQGLKPAEYIDKISKQLYDGLLEIPGLKVLNSQAASVISVYSPNIDAHRLAIFLSGAGIMVRSGYFCCHYYLIEKLKMPPLLRFSIGLHTTENDIIKTLETLKKFI
jgi:cysteine desulfurase/selenocysteine lyase